MPLLQPRLECSLFDDIDEELQDIVERQEVLLERLDKLENPKVVVSFLDEERPKG